MTFKKNVINRCSQVVLNNNMLKKQEHEMRNCLFVFKSRIYFFRKLAILFRKNRVISNNVLNVKIFLKVFFVYKYVSNT